MRLSWPLPAIAVWVLTWALFLGLIRAGAGPLSALAVGGALSALASVWGGTWWRRLMIALGFPLSLAASGLVALPAWAWLVPLLLLLLIYPLNAWRDAPLFPTPSRALNELSSLVVIRDGAPVLDAGCGLGDGLKALRAAYPTAHLTGIEWSWPLRALCALRCPWATVYQGDIWQADWSGFDLVYLFQRPESMPRAVEKARSQLKPGAWLVSLEFEAQNLQPVAKLDTLPGKPVWVYRMPLQDKTDR